MGEGGFDHIPVLSRQVLELLEPNEGDVYVDATAGLGGHAAMVAEANLAKVEAMISSALRYAIGM